MSDDEDLTRLCRWCGRAFRLGTTGRRAVYCRRACRQRAYEARREAQRIEYALAMAAADSSRDSPRTPADSTRDEMELGPVLPDPGDGWVRSPDEVDAQLRELEARRAAPVPAPARRRPLAPPRPAAPTLFDTQPGPGETRADTE